MNELINATDYEIIVKEKKSEFLKIDEGHYIGRCIGIFICGTQKSVFKGKEKHNPEVIFEFEIADHLMVYDETLGKMIWGNGKGSKPYTIRNIYNANLNEKSNLSKDLESWRDHSFTEKERAGFNICQMIGQPAMLTIHNKTTESTGETYPRIVHIQPILFNQDVPSQVLESQILTFERWNQEVYENLSKWTRDKIALSPEFKNLVANGTAEEVAEED